MHFMRVGSNRCKYILRRKMRDIRVNVDMESFVFLSSSVCYFRFFLTSLRCTKWFSFVAGVN